MNEGKKKVIDSALQKAGFKTGRIVIGTYDTSHKRRLGVYFHYNFTEELINALVQLASQDKTVYDGLRELRENYEDDIPFTQKNRD